MNVITRAGAGKEHLERWNIPPWFMAALASLVVEVYLLIALGGAVRIMNAGLACPDWPLCFGDFIPDYHPQVYMEFIHRVFAGLVSVATGLLTYWLGMRTRAPLGLKRLLVGASVLVLVQALFGGLTVIHKLEAWVVTTHLGLGTGFFALVLIIYLRAKEPAPPGLSQNLRRWSAFVGAAVYTQILLGGLVAAHYASLVCTDFPTCHGEWFPTFSGIIGLHVIHRLGAYTVFTIILANFIIMLNLKQPKRVTKLAAIMFGLVCLQVAIGIANVIYLTPPLVAIAHLATATAILSVAVRQMHYANIIPLHSVILAEA